MKILPPKQSERVAPLVKESGMRGHLALVYEVIEGRMDGMIFVDDTGSPRTALVCNSNGFCFAFGAPDAEGPADAVDRLVMHNEGGMVLFGSHPGWDAALAVLLGSIGGEPVTRVAFEQHSEPIPPPLPEGFRIEPIGESIAERIIDGEDTGGMGIDPWFINIAGGPRGYASLGLGLAITQGNQIASIAGVCGMGGGEVELEVGTSPTFRGLGLATIVSAAFMKQVRKWDMVPAYSCTVDNLASLRVAQRLGFVEMERIRGYNIPHG